MIEKPTVFYITNINGGGSFKYIKDLISSFPETSFIAITNDEEFMKHATHFSPNHILLLQYVIHTNLSMKHILYIVRKTKIRLILPIHDFYYVSPSIYETDPTLHNSYLLDSVNILPEKRELLLTATHLICPSLFVWKEMMKYITSENAIVCPHIDYHITWRQYIPPIINNTIHIALINELNECKGVEYYKQLCNIQEYKNHRIVYHVFTGSKTLSSSCPNVIVHPRYQNENIIILLYTNNIHSLLFLSKWGETYCYGLTHALRSSLPILYSNVGAFTERIPTSPHYFPVNPNPITKIVDFSDI